AAGRTADRPGRRYSRSGKAQARPTAEGHGFGLQGDLYVQRPEDHFYRRQSRRYRVSKMAQKCPECGKIGGDQRFCKYCGALLPGDSPAPVMLQPPPVRRSSWKLSVILAVIVLCLTALGFWAVKRNPGGKSESREGSV